MFIPVPHIRTSRTTVINKTVIYSDTVLNLKDLGSNIKLTTVSGVNKFSLESCLNYILEENPTVIFNTVQYSEQTQKVYFYTDKEISTKSWDNRNLLNNVPIETSKQIVEECDKILTSSPITDSYVISLATISELIKKEKAKVSSFEKSAEWKLETALKENIDSGCQLCFHNFDYSKKEINFSFKYYNWMSSWEDFCIKKSKDGDLYIKESNSFYTDEVFYAICSTLSEVYDGFINLKYLFDNPKYGISSINSNFKIDISIYGVEISSKNFSLDLRSYDNNYNVICNSSLVISKVKGNEQALFEKIYVRIDDCPKWMQKQLYTTRQDELKPKEKNKPVKKESFIKRVISFFKNF